MGLEQPAAQSSPRYDLDSYPSHLRPVKVSSTVYEGRGQARRDDAHQAWGDYMAAMEGTEI